jgi:hypothetical protein
MNKSTFTFLFHRAAIVVTLDDDGTMGAVIETAKATWRPVWRRSQGSAMEFADAIAREYSELVGGWYTGEDIPLVKGYSDGYEEEDIAVRAAWEDGVARVLAEPAARVFEPPLYDPYIKKRIMSTENAHEFPRYYARLLGYFAGLQE